MKTTQVMEAKTAAEDTDKINITSNNPTTFIAYGMVGGDLATIQISYDGGTNFVDCSVGGADVILDASDNHRTVYGPGTFRVSKGVTTGLVGVSYSRC